MERNYCLYGDICKNPDCPYDHSSNPIPANAPTPNENSKFANFKYSVDSDSNRQKDKETKINKKECKFGEKCKFKDCKYSHTTSTIKQCKYGQNCKKKEVCKFDHPPASNSEKFDNECKYGENCKKKGQCKFNHPPPSQTSDKQKTKKAIKGICNFGKDCKKKNECQFIHPDSDNPINNMPTHKKDDDNSSIRTIEKAIKGICNFGKDCKKKNECQFIHPDSDNPINNMPTPKTNDDNSSIGTVEKAIKGPCIFGKDCKKKNECQFIHPDSDSPINNMPTPKTNEDNSSIGTVESILCVVGENCLDFYCTFSHPKSRTRTCDRGNECKRISCKLLHPETRKGACPQGVTCEVYECDFLHPPPRPFRCKKNTKCFKPTCKNLHSSKRTKVCKDLNSCQIFECTFLHSNNRKQPCKKGEKCQKANCDKLHPPKAQACENGSNCIDFSCELSHPEDRIRKCSKKCKNPRCDFLHPLDWNIKTMVDEKVKSLWTLQEREAYRLKNKLPIYNYKSQIISRLKRDKILIITGPPASGKSTQIPQYIAEEFPGLVVCTNPYPMITMLNAQTIAKQFDNDQVGESVGYKIDCGKGFSGKKIQMIQDSVLVKKNIGKDPLLKSVNVLIIDETDRRGVYTDLLIGIAKGITKKRLDDFYVVVITSDMYANQISDLFFGQNSQNILNLPTKNVESNELENPSDDLGNLDNLISAIMIIRKKYLGGNVLVFLPSVAEINEAIKKLNKMTKNKYNCCALHAGLSAEAIAAVLNSPKENPKVIFCTDIAESVLQIPNVQVVIDNGIITETRYDPKKRLDVMKQTFISKEQKMLRKACISCDENENGIYISLYPSANLKERNEPEILRLSLETYLLQLKILNIDPITFPFLTQPREDELINSYQLLKEFNCLDDSIEQTITSKGKLFASLPFDLKLNNFVALGHELYDEGESFAIIAAAISSLESLFSIKKDENKNNMVKENIMKKASKHNSDLELLFETFIEWFQSGNSQGSKCAKCSRSISKADEGCRFCRVLFAQKKNLNSKSMDGILKIKSKVQQLLQRFPSKEKKDTSIAFTEKIAKCLISSFPELIGELLLPENPSIGVHLLHGGEKGSFSPTSTFLQKSQKNLNFLIAMSLTTLPNGYVILDQVHPLLNEWIPESIMKKFDASTKQIQECIKLSNCNGKYKIPLIKEIKKIEKSNKWAAYTIVNYEDNDLRVYGPKSNSKEIEVFCSDVINKLRKVEMEQEISLPICNGTGVVSISSGMTVTNLQPGTNTQIRFLLEKNINTKEEFLKWLCDNSELKSDDIKWCNIFKGKNKAFSIVGFEDEASVKKAFKVKNASFNYSNDEISKTVCLTINHDSYDLSNISQKLKAMENPPINISELRPPFFQIILKKLSKEFRQNNGYDLKRKLFEDLKDLKSVNFSKDFNHCFLKFLSIQARDDAMLTLSQNPVSKETLNDDNKRENHNVVIRFSKVKDAQNFVKNAYKAIIPEAISCEGREIVRVKKAHLFLRLEEFLQSISSKYKCSYEIDTQKNKNQKEEPYTSVIFKGALPIIVGKASKELLKIIAPLSVRFPTKQQKVLIKEIDDLDLFDQWDQTLGLEHKTFEDDKTGEIFKLEVYGNQVSQGIYMANILQYSDGFNARYQTIPVPNNLKFLFKKNMSGSNFLKKANQDFKDTAYISYENFGNLIQIYIKPKSNVKISSVNQKVKDYFKNSSAEKENADLDQALNPCVYCQKSGGQPFSICGHHYCSNCLANDIRNNCEIPNQLAKLECPECKSPISIKDLKFSMTDEDFQKEAQNLAISFLSMNKNLPIAQCPGSNCESFKLKDAGYSICTWCETESCVLCGEQNNIYHQAKSCAECKEAQQLAEKKKNMINCLVQGCLALREKKYSICQECQIPSCPVCGSENTPLHMNKTCYEYKEEVKKKFSGVDLPKIIQKAKNFIEEKWDSIQLGKLNRIEVNPGLESNCPSMAKFCAAIQQMGEKVLDNGFYAWHGTGTENGVVGICHDGFDPSRRSGQVYGPGEYFGQAPTISHSYAGNSNRMIVTFILKVPQVFKQDNFCYVVNNPKDFSLSYNLPVMVLNYKQELPPVKFLGVKIVQRQNFEHKMTNEINNKSWDMVFRWFWQTDSRAYQPYNDNISLLIEKEFVLYQDGKRDHRFITPPITRFIDDVPQIYCIDFIQQLQINGKTGYQRKIKRENVDISTSNAVWLYQDENDVWKPFESFVQSKIEQAFLNYRGSRGSSLLTNLTFPGRPESYTINFCMGIQINESSNTFRNIQRKAI